jgi:hypothetical protein
MTAAAPAAPLPLSTILRQPVTRGDGHFPSALADIVVRLGGGDYPLVTGIVVTVGGARAFAPASDLTTLEPGRVRLAASAVDLHEFHRREDEVLLSEDVMGHRLIDTTLGAIVRAYDVRLSPTVDGWRAVGLDVHRRRRLADIARHADHPPRDWKDFDPLIGHQGTAIARTGSSRLHRLKAWRIADILDQAARHEHAELLGVLQRHPGLEAEVFDQLDQPV